VEECLHRNNPHDLRMIRHSSAAVQAQTPARDAGRAPGVRYGLGVSVLNDPAQAGNLGSRGQFGWPGFAMSSRRSPIRRW